MAYAADRVVDASTDSTAPRHRPGKSLREPTRFTGNLMAYRKELSALPPFATSAAVKQIRPASAFRHHGADNVRLAAQPANQVAANSARIPANADQLPSGGATRSQLAVAIVSCLCLGAVLGRSWPMIINRLDAEIPAPLPATQDNTQNNSQGNTQDKNVATASDSLTGTPAVSPEIAADSLPPTSVQSASRTQPALPDPAVLQEGYLDEIDWLRSQNTALQDEVNVLAEETLDLNEELLQLELQVASLHAETEAFTETQVVYNFVNVPIGSGVDAAGALNPSSRPAYADNNVPGVAYIGGVSYADSTDTSYSDVELQNLELDTAQNDPDALAAAYESNQEGAYTNEQLSQAEANELLWETSNEQYPTDVEVIYDPDTGFYVDPSYIADEMQFAIDANERIDYPPLANEQ